MTDKTVVLLNISNISYVFRCFVIALLCEIKKTVAIHTYLFMRAADSITEFIDVVLLILINKNVIYLRDAYSLNVRLTTMCS